MTFVYKPDQHNPNVSGEHSLKGALILAAVFVVGIGVLIYSSSWIAERVLLSIGPETEQSIFRHMSFKDAPEWREGKQILRKLVGAEADTISIYLDTETEPNALAAPGQRIYVNCGLLKSVTTENGLAFVLAHEIGHLRNRDHLRGIGRALGFSLVSMMLGLDPSSTTALDLTHTFLDRSFSRDQESAADDVAIELTRAAYGGLVGASEFFRSIGDESRLTGILSTHPLPQDRAARIEALDANGTRVPLEPALLAGCQ